jgi:hypothetical protein
METILQPQTETKQATTLATEAKGGAGMDTVLHPPAEIKQATTKTIEAKGGAGMDTVLHPQAETKQAPTHTTEAHEGAPVNATPNSQAETEQEDMALLLERAKKGDRSVLPKLREALDADPRIWQNYGDLAQQSEASLIVLAAGENILLAESLQRKLSALKEDLGGPSPSPLERLLVERVTATWLQVNFYDGLIAQTKDTKNARWKLIERHQDAATRRHLASIKALATVRKLLTTAPSPLEIARRMDVPESVARRCREGFAGKVLVPN